MEVFVTFLLIVFVGMAIPITLIFAALMFDLVALLYAMIARKGIRKGKASELRNGPIQGESRERIGLLRRFISSLRPLRDHMAWDRHDILFRTGARPALQFKQFLIVPYIGDGSPVDQSMFIDDLRLATSRIP